MTEDEGSSLIRLSVPVLRVLRELKAERAAVLGRAVTYSEVIEQLLADRAEVQR